MLHFCTPLKHQKIVRFSHFFKRFRNVTRGRNDLNKLIFCTPDIPFKVIPGIIFQHNDNANRVIMAAMFSLNADVILRVTTSQVSFFFVIVLLFVRTILQLYCALFNFEIRN